MAGLTRKTVDRRLLAAGALLVLLGLAMPCFLSVRTFDIYGDLDRAAGTGSAFRLLLAAGKLLLLNIVRALPHYVGAFFVADSFRGCLPKSLLLPSAAAVILAVYGLIELIYGIHYDLGVPAALGILWLMIILRVDLSMVSPLKRAGLVGLLLCAVQCLDIMPALSGYGFGNGDASLSVKAVAAFLEQEPVLNLTAAAVMLIMLVNVVLYTLVLVDENRIVKGNRERAEQAEELMRVRLQAEEARTQLELKELVHDLKSPLTAAETLVGILQLDEEDDFRRAQLDKTENALERMSELISEFLDERHFTRTSAQEIMQSVMAQVSVLDCASSMEYHVPEEVLVLEANKIRISRCLVNLIQNAWFAVDHPGGRIRAEAERTELEGVPAVRFSVSDNGSGLREEEISRIFESGYSSRGSSGLGLSFVKKVTEEHGGKVLVSSKPGEGSTFSLLLPAVNEGEEGVPE